jgi:hypothetical protein
LSKYCWGNTNKTLRTKGWGWNSVFGPGFYPQHCKANETKTTKNPDDQKLEGRI